MGDYIENYKNKILHYINIPLIQYSFDTGSHMFYLSIVLLLAKNKQKLEKSLKYFWTNIGFFVLKINDEELF